MKGANRKNFRVRVAKGSLALKKNLCVKNYSEMQWDKKEKACWFFIVTMFLLHMLSGGIVGLLCRDDRAEIGRCLVQNCRNFPEGSEEIAKRFRQDT